MIIDLAYVKKYFPLWSSFFIDDSGTPSDDVLQNDIDLAEAEMAIYIPITYDETNPAPAPVQLHLLNIVKKRGFDRKHGDSSFENEPQIVKDYNWTINELKRLRDNGGALKIFSKPRRFHQWFNDDGLTSQ